LGCPETSSFSERKYLNKVINFKTKFVVITGGEPLYTILMVW
jgi:organic radical activating enzyme